MKKLIEVTMSLKRRTNEIDKYIGNSLKTLRKQKGVSQDSLGEVLGVSLQQIQKYEQGKNRISAASLYKLSLYFEISLDVFFRQFDQVSNTENAIDIGSYELQSMQNMWLKLNDQDFKKIIINVMDQKIKNSH
ncbi:MAG: helix-turn-helix domain-containing protein [Alphaproteobacteria bacterium]|nr:helix-turn-helix domain-containing protein [Alphaproteobacteria bacterium]